MAHLDRDADQRPLKVLLWSPGGSGEHYSGPGSFSYRLYATAPPGSIEITLAHGSPDQKHYELFKEQVRIGNKSATRLGRIMFTRAGCQWVKRHSNEFDIFHALGGYYNSIRPAFEAEKAGLPSVLFVTNHLQLSDRPGIEKKLGISRKKRELVKSLSNVVAMSDDIHEELLSYGVSEHNISRIPMGVDSERFSPPANVEKKDTLRQKLGLANVPTVLFVGTLVRRKRPHLLVDAMVKLKKERIDSQIVMVGPSKEPAYRASLDAQIQESGLTDNVKIVDFTSEIVDYYQCADMLCLPSINEGMAASLVEGMACGLAPIVTPISGSRDLVEDGTNGRILGGAGDELADIIKQYVLDSASLEQHGQRSRQLVEDTYSNRVVFDQYYTLFKCLSR